MAPSVLARVREPTTANYINHSYRWTWTKRFLTASLVATIFVWSVIYVAVLDLRVLGMTVGWDRVEREIPLVYVGPDLSK